MGLVVGREGRVTDGEGEADGESESLSSSSSSSLLSSLSEEEEEVDGAGAGGDERTNGGVGDCECADWTGDSRRRRFTGRTRVSSSNSESERECVESLSCSGTSVVGSIVSDVGVWSRTRWGSCGLGGEEEEGSLMSSRLEVDRLEKRCVDGGSTGNGVDGEEYRGVWLRLKRGV